MARDLVNRMLLVEFVSRGSVRVFQYVAQSFSLLDVAICDDAPGSFVIGQALDKLSGNLDKLFQVFIQQKLFIS